MVYAKLPLLICLFMCLFNANFKTSYGAAPPRQPTTVSFITWYINKIMMMLDRNVPDISKIPQELLKFYPPNPLKPIPITPRGYIIRLFEYMYCSVACFILALIYIERFVDAVRCPCVVDDAIRHCQQSHFNTKSFHRIFLIALILAIKFLEDEHYKNDYYARVGGIGNEKLNDLELFFISKISANFFVTEAEINQIIPMETLKNLKLPRPPIHIISEDTALADR